MNLGDESLKTIRATHLLSIAVSAATLVLLFAPFESDFREALREARILKELSTRGFEKYAHDAIGLAMASPEFLPHGPNNSQYAGSELVGFVERQICCISPESTVEWSVTPVLTYDPPPIGKPLQEWPTWINQKAPAHYLIPDWSDFYISQDTRQGSQLSTHRDPQCDEKCTPADLRALRFFIVSPSDPGMSGQPWYRFRAFFDLGLQRKPPSPWWLALEDLPLSKFEEKPLVESLAKEKRSMVEGFVRVSSTLGQTALPPIGAWIKYEPSTKGLFQSTRPDDIGLPNLREHWSVLATKPLDEAIVFMEQEQKHIRDVSLFGISVPGSLCVVAIPLAFAVSHLYLLLHLYSCIGVVSTMKDPPSDHFPWIGIYKEMTAQLVTSFSLTLVPGLLTALLIFRYHTRLGLVATIPATFLGAIALILGWLASTQTAKFRGLLLKLEICEKQPEPEAITSNSHASEEDPETTEHAPF
jgi:hypothetical protein